MDQSLPALKRAARPLGSSRAAHRVTTAYANSIAAVVPQLITCAGMGLSYECELGQSRYRIRTFSSKFGQHGKFLLFVGPPPARTIGCRARKMGTFNVV